MATNLSSTQSSDVNISRFILLAIPLVLFVAAESLMRFFDNFLLTRYSLFDWQANHIATPFVQLFEIPTIRMAAIAQVYVGQAFSAGEMRRIGLFVWQMVWLSLFSIAFVLPMGWGLSTLFLSSSPLETTAQRFCYLMQAGNFVFPLGIALSSFYVGRGRMAFVICMTFMTLLINCALDFLFIFGVEGFFPPLGLRGAALAKLCSHGFLCSVLFCAFLKKKNRSQFGTDQWKFHPKTFFNCLKVSGSTALYVGFITLSWLAVVKMISWKHDDNLTTIMSFGNSCSFLWAFINLGISQALTLRASQVIGSRQWNLISQLIRSLALTTSGLLVLISIPLLFFPKFFLAFYFGERFHTFSPELVRALISTCFAMWGFEMIGAFDRTLRDLLTAAGDTVYIFLTYMIMILCFNIIPMYYVLHIWNWPPQTFWYVMNVGIFVRNLPLLYRLKQKRWESSPSLAAAHS